MWRAGILLLLAASAAAQDVEELKKLAPAFDTAKGEGPESFRIDVRGAVGVFRVAYDHGRGSLVVWNRFDGCPLLVACGKRAIFYDVLWDKLQVLEDVFPSFEFLLAGGELKLHWGGVDATDASRAEIRADVGSILARCRSLQVVDLGNGKRKLRGRTEGRNLFAAWIDPEASPAYRRIVLVWRAPVSLEREADRLEVAFGAAAPGDFPSIPDFKTLAQDFAVERARGLADDSSQKELLGRMLISVVLAQGLARADKRAEVEAGFGSPVVWKELEKPYAKARKTLVTRFGRGPLAGSYEEAKESFGAREAENARRGFEHALKDGDTRALVYLGYLAWRVDGDVARAEKYFRRAAGEEHAEAQYALAWLLANEDGVPRDPEQAATWYRRAAESGHVKAAANLGLAYEKGFGVAEDRKEAARWYEIAAEAGQADAQYALAALLFKGEDYPKAVEWYTRAAEQGHAKAQLMLGICYVSGRGVDKDMAAATFRFRQAAEQGNAPAQRFLGKAYAIGTGVEKDSAEAVKWLEAAAKQGLAEACVDLAQLYDKGKGVPRNAARAHAFYVLGGNPDQAARLAKELTPEQLADSKRVQLLYRPAK